MSRVGMNIAEQGHLVNILPPVDVDGAVNSDVFSMANYAHASIIITAGVTGADAGNITLEECDDFVPTASTAIAFSYYGEPTPAGDTLSVRMAATVAGIDVSANDSIMYVIEIDASELSAGFPNLRIAWSDPGAATFGAAVAVLTGARYGKERSASAIA